MFQLRSTRSHSKKLSTPFKRIVGPADDGAVPEEKKNPSIPVIVRLRVNNKPMNAMVDTGSASSIIHIHALNSLAHRPHMQQQINVHRAANNTELKTIGIVELKINIGNMPTFILAEVSTDLCTELVLGNDWIRANGIDIITTEKCIRKRRGSITASAPIIEFDQRSYPVFPIQRIRILPEQQMVVPIRTHIQNADTVIFTPSGNFVESKHVLIPHALLKIENGLSWITIMNACEYPCYLNTNMMIGTISFPLPTAVSLPLLQAEHRIHSNTVIDLKCRACYESFKSKTDLFEHLHRSGHYCKQGSNGSSEQLPPHVHQHIKRMTDHISNSHEKNQVEAILIKYGSIFDTSKPTTIDTIVHHTIEVGNSRPIMQRPYRKTPMQEKIIADMCEQFYREKIIRPSQSPWSSPVVLQKKKDGSWRFCVDYRKLNEVTEKDNYPLPRVQEIFDTLTGAKYFSKIDFKGGYHQVPIAEKDKLKTAFVTRD
jgi:hypothetical protein